MKKHNAIDIYNKEGVYMACIDLQDIDKCTTEIRKHIKLALKHKQNHSKTIHTDPLGYKYIPIIKNNKTKCYHKQYSNTRSINNE